MNDHPVDGFLLVDKAGGWTSHDVVARVRKLSRIRKVGHAGTLDPMATGLVVLGLGRATRLLRFVQDLPKDYRARVAFGIATDSLDADGAVLSREPMPIAQDDLAGVLPRFTGTILQVPPMVSAVKVGGRRLYQLAREGHEVEREARPVVVYRLEVEDYAPGDYPEATLRVVCGKGTYVRSLADDMARALGGRAHLIDLRRLAIGSMRVEDGHSIEDLERASDHLPDLMLAPIEGLRDLPVVAVGADTARAVRIGMRFAHGLEEVVAAGGPAAVVGESGELLAVYRGEGRLAVPEVVLR